MPYWDERVEEMASAYPDVSVDKFHIDILTAQFVLHPDWFDVVVASNLFGDILSDLGPACTGTIGIAPSGNINPERRFPFPLRTGPRFGAGHRRAGDRQPDRPDLGRCDDAGASRSRRKRPRGIVQAIETVLADKTGCDARPRRERRYRDMRQGHRGRARLSASAYHVTLAPAVQATMVLVLANSPLKLANSAVF